MKPEEYAPATVPLEIPALIEDWLDKSADYADIMRRFNALQAVLFNLSPVPHAVAQVLWVHVDDVQANDYNPNAVAGQEMRLLHTSISEDGYTQPTVTIWDPEINKYVIVDGYHRYTVMRKYQDIYDLTEGFMPIVVIDKPIADRIASTVRHNRARGKHSVAGMSDLVFQMLTEGETDETICDKIGLEAEELVRLKHLTGYSKLYANVEYSPVVMTKRQMDEKAAYKKEHPDEHIPPSV